MNNITNRPDPNAAFPNPNLPTKREAVCTADLSGVMFLYVFSHLSGLIVN